VNQRACDDGQHERNRRANEHKAFPTGHESHGLERMKPRPGLEPSLLRAQVRTLSRIARAPTSITTARQTNSKRNRQGRTSTYADCSTGGTVARSANHAYVRT